jgi:hypothetical protein
VVGACTYAYTMSRGEGFDRMDVNTSIDDDPKFRVMSRRYPALLATAGWAYVGLLGHSWREGRRLTLEEGWPSLLPYDQATADAMVDVGLLDCDLFVPETTWESWFGNASERRRLGRDRQQRYDAKRRGALTEGPSGSQSIQTDGPAVSQSGPTSGQRRPDVGAEDLTTCPGCGDELDDRDPQVAVVGRRGQLTHRQPCVSLDMDRVSGLRIIP